MSLVEIISDLILNKDYQEKPIRVLVVEDDPTGARIWTQSLYGKCEDVILRHDMASTMKYLADNNADVLILDWRLPNGDGNAILNHWLSDFGGPVAVISGLIEPEDETKLYQRGAWHVLQKPVDLSVFIAVVANYIDIAKRRNRQEWYEVEIQNLKRKQSVLLAALVIVTAGQQALNFFI